MEGVLRFPQAWFVWASYLATVGAVVCGILAVINGIANAAVVGVNTGTLLQAGIGAMLFAIWCLAMLRVLYGGVARYS